MQRVRERRKPARVAAPTRADEAAAAERLAFGDSGSRAAPLQLTPQRKRRGVSHRDELIAQSPRSRTGDGRQRSMVERLRDTLDALLSLERPRQLSATEEGNVQTSCPPSWIRGAPCPLDSAKCAHAVQLGCDVLQFPFAPMPPQLAVAERSLLACERGGIAMLQSPTGTGKSLALLSATLAWQRRCFAKRGAAPQILYGVRTHSQLAQMVRELRKSPYRPRMAIIGSREQLCANEQVKAQAKSKGVPLNLACRQAGRRAVQDNMFQRRWGSREAFGVQGSDQLGCSCSMYTSLADVRHARRVFEKCSQAGNIWDIEDLFRASGTSSSNTNNSAAGCPYYTSHILAGTADIVFCPHNYILDPAVSKCRTHHRERWSLEGRVVVIDEAHNLEQCCREAGSLQVKLQELTQLTKSLRSLPLRHPRFRFSVGGNSSSASSAGEGRRSLSCAEACAVLERVPLQLASFLQAQHRPQAGTKSNSQASEPCPLSNQMQTVWGLPGRPHTADFLGRAGLSEHHLLSQGTEDLILEVTDKILQVQLENETTATESQGAAPAVGVRENCDAEDAALLMVLDRLRELIFKLRLASRHPDSYVMGIRTEALEARASETSLNVWLMAPGVLFEVFTAPAHAVLLASGTLAPLGALGAELSNSSALATRALREGPLEAFHVVQPHQLLAAVVPCFLSSGQRAVSTFGCWQSPDFLLQLGETLELLVASIPGGVLCFFPSYQSLDSAVGAWKHATTWQRFKDLKGAVVVEPRGAGTEMSKACAAFASGVASGSGALCLAVYRGKMSEGLDFADELCRGVICIGVPYPQTNDPVVLAKRKWNDARRGSVTSESKWLSGEQWYELQAHRAINQALGRLLRHRRDYGALVLLDARWASRGDCARGLRRHLAKWLQPHLCEWPTTNKELVGQFCDRLKRHFDEAKQLACREVQTHAAGVASVWPATDAQSQSLLKATSHSPQQSCPLAAHQLKSSPQWSNVWRFSPTKQPNESTEPATIGSIKHTRSNSTTSAAIGMGHGASSSNNTCTGDDNAAAPMPDSLAIQVRQLPLESSRNINSSATTSMTSDSLSSTAWGNDSMSNTCASMASSESLEAEPQQFLSGVLPQAQKPEVKQQQNLHLNFEQLGMSQPLQGSSNLLCPSSSEQGQDAITAPMIRGSYPEGNKSSATAAVSANDALLGENQQPSRLPQQPSLEIQRQSALSVENRQTEMPLAMSNTWRTSPSRWGAGVQDSESDAATEQETDIDSDSSCVCLADVHHFTEERGRLVQQSTSDNAQQKILEQHQLSEQRVQPCFRHATRPTSGQSSSHALLSDRSSDQNWQYLDTSRQPAAGKQGQTTWLGINTTVPTPLSSVQSVPPETFLEVEGKACLKRPCPFLEPASFAVKNP